MVVENMLAIKILYFNSIFDNNLGMLFDISDLLVFFRHVKEWDGNTSLEDEIVYDFLT